MKDIHPKKQLVKIKLTNDQIIEVMMCTTEKEKELSIDPFNHQAWSKNSKRKLHGSALNKFKIRYQ